MDKIPEFTQEQEDYICFIIDGWYFSWKTTLVDYESKTHRLGIAKEQLKNLICDLNGFLKNLVDK